MKEKCKLCKEYIRNGNFKKCKGTVKVEIKKTWQEVSCDELFHKKCFKKHWETKHMKKAKKK